MSDPEKVLAERLEPHLDQAHDEGWAGCVVAAQHMADTIGSPVAKKMWQMLIDQMMEAGRTVCEDFDGALKRCREEFEGERDARG